MSTYLPACEHFLMFFRLWGVFSQPSEVKLSIQVKREGQKVGLVRRFLFKDGGLGE